MKNRINPDIENETQGTITFGEFMKILTGIPVEEFYNNLKNKGSDTNGKESDMG